MSQQQEHDRDGGGRSPGPRSGYREEQDHRGRPGQDQKKDGRQLPEETDEAGRQPGAGAEDSVPEAIKRGD